ncbi:MAG: hypothetical protein V1876_04395 [Candidatus Peregrinibacteria bacterium]
MAELDVAVVAALQAVTQDLRVLVARMREVDAAFTAAVEQKGADAVQAMIRGTVVPQRWASEILAKIDFASSLVSD